MADRRTSVSLELKASQFKAEADTAKVKVEGLDRSVEKLDRDITKIPPDAAKAAASLKLLGDESGKAGVALEDGVGKSSTSLGVLNQRLKAAQEEVRRLAEEFNRTGSATTLENLFSADKAVKNLERLKKDLTRSLESGAAAAGRSVANSVAVAIADGSQQGFKEGAKTFAASIQGVLSTPVLGPITAGVLIGAIVAAAPAVGAALGGVLASVAGLGGIGLIVAGQLQSPLVKAAATQLGHDVTNSLSVVTAPFAGRLSAGLGVIDTGLQKLITSLGPALANLSGTIGPLSQGVAKLFAALGPGLSKAFNAAVPILLVLAKQLPSIGRALSDFFNSLAKGGKGSAEGLQYLIMGINSVIRVSGELIMVLSDIFQFLVAFGDEATGILSKVFGWVPLLGDHLRKNHDMFHELRGGVDEAGLGVDKLDSSFQGLAPDLQSTATLTQQAATAFQNLSKGIDAAFGRTMGIDQATLQYNIGVTNLEKSLDKYGASLDVSTVSGQKNLGAIQAQISNINTLRDANIANGKGVDWSNQQADAQYVQLEKMLIQWGFNKDAVHALIDQYRQIPHQVSTVVNVLGLDAATTKLDSISTKFDTLNGRVVTTYLVTDTTTGQQSRISHSRGIQRWGGVYEHAETGLLNAGIYPAMSPARYAFAEPATGGEAFVPKFGDYGRSTSIIDQAARWYGGRFTSGGSSPAPIVNVIVSPKDGAIGALVDLIDVRVEHGNQSTANAVSAGPRL